MEYRYLGRSGLRVSVLSIGAWTTWGSTISDDEAFNSMKIAYDMGCNFFDNAEVYGDGKAEVAMGKCIKRLAVDRSQLVITTKIYWGGQGVNQRGLSRKHILEGTKKSLARLDLEYVDCIFAHRPDPETPMEETVRAFSHLIDVDKAFYWGTSEWSAEQIQQAILIAKDEGLIAPIFEQPQYSMLHRTRVESEYANLYKEYGLGNTIWSPLAGGLLTGKYNSKTFPTDARLSGQNQYSWLQKQLLSGEGMNGLEEKNFDTILTKVDALTPIAKSLDCTLAQLAIAWCAVNRNVSTVITGASKSAQVTENFRSLNVIPKLTPTVMQSIEDILKNKPKSPKQWK